MSSLRFAAIWSSALCLISAMVLITVFATYPLVFNNEVHRIFVIAVIIFAPVAPFAALRAKAYAIYGDFSASPRRYSSLDTSITGSTDALPVGRLKHHLQVGSRTNGPIALPNSVPKEVGVVCKNLISSPGSSVGSGLRIQSGR
ncbi:hypothetical protein [Sphingopyxis sp.]|uniref:hypothetical protein n=1 Tax=Sphingopyxis sp. TaxID=1908224 RepID=UPI003D14B884